MADFLALPSNRIDVVPLGINMEGHVHPSVEERTRRDEFRVGYLARVAPEKGLRLLAEAYVRFRKRTAGAEVRLEVAGYAAPAQQSYLADVRGLLERAGLAEEFAYRGVVDRNGKLAFLGGLNVLSVPATYDEPKGMFLLEAMASGVPVVQPRRGAFTEIVENTGGGVLVEPDNPDALAEGLFALWSDRAASAALGQRAFEGVRQHYGVERSAEKLLGVYRSLLRDEN
jgi:glycosyltransferase involved in cell wall biosynthesis